MKAIGIAIFTFGLLLSGLGCKTNKNNAAAGMGESSQLATKMIGTWVHVGRPGQLMAAPTKGGRFKYRTGTHWVVITVDPDKGLVQENFGGTYTMHGDEYAETQTYADYNWLRDNGKTFKFMVRIQGDTMTQLGIDNPYTEVWQRVK